MKQRKIEYIQTALYRAKMGDLSIYENGDCLIAPVPEEFVKNGIISIPENELLLIDDETFERYGKTSQEVYELLKDWLVIDEMNLNKEEYSEVIMFFVNHGVKVDEEDLKYLN